jgi:hypothetical protein
MSDPKLLLGVPISMKHNYDGGHIIATYDADVGLAGLHSNVLDVTFTLVTGSYASGTVVAAMQEVTYFMNTSGGLGIVTGFNMLDKEAQNVAMTVIFADSAISIGAEHSPYSISDSDAEHILGRIEIATADYKTYGNNGHSRIIYRMIDDQMKIPYLIKAASGTSSIWIGIINGSGAPIWTGNMLLAKLPVIYP